MTTSPEQLISQLTLAEKVSLLAGVDQWHTRPVERLGIPAIKVTDGPNGARGAGGEGAPSSACFPVGIAMGATWNPDLIRRLGVALAQETQAKGAHILLGPTVNMHRSPLAGRNFECFSEDPYLSGRLAVAYIQGLQSEGIGACIKHFACNDSEFERFTISSQVGERALHEIYLAPFRAALSEAQPWMVMSAYNRINGTYASENRALLLDILKGEWGFDGMVISDWYGTNSLAVAQGGLDLEMPGPARWMDERQLAAVEAGTLDEAIIDEKVKRLLRTIHRVGAFEQPDLQPERAEDRPEHRQVARQAAAEAIVLLKNSGDLLPLNLERLDSIAVIGQNARWAQIMGGGSSEVSPHYVVSPLEGIRQRVGDQAQVSYHVGCLMHQRLPLLDRAWLAGDDGTTGELLVEYFDDPAFDGEPIHTERTWDTRLSWFGYAYTHFNPARFAARITGSFRVPQSGSYTFGLAGLGLSRLWIDDALVIDNWTSVPAWDSSEQQAPVQLEVGRRHRLRIDYYWEGDTRWRDLRLGCLPAMPADPIAEAVALAATADVAIVLAGLTKDWEGEGRDRVDMELPGDQAELIRRVAAANPKTIVVLNAGSPVTMDWLGAVPAVLQLWYPGQEGGNALADVLFGDVDPSGRLPTTFPRHLRDNPAYLNYPGEHGQVLYGEGIFIGYRYYDRKAIAPLFPFGHGLSYANFEYGNLELDSGQYGLDQPVNVTFQVTNTSSRAGQEVVQLYVRDVQSSLVRPEKELKAFTKVQLAAGETRSVSFTLGKEALAFYDPSEPGWVVEPGEFEVLVGRSAEDIRLVERFSVVIEPSTGWDGLATFHVGQPLSVLLADPGARAVLRRHFGQAIEQPEISLVADHSLEEIAQRFPHELTPDKLQAISRDLAGL